MRLRRPLVIAAAVLAAAGVAGCGATDPMAEFGCVPTAGYSDGEPRETTPGTIGCKGSPPESASFVHLYDPNDPTDVLIHERRLSRHPLCVDDAAVGCWRTIDGADGYYGATY